MASSISFSGIGSGIDGAGIAKAAADQIRLQNEVHQQSLAQLTEEKNSLESFRTLLIDLADKLENLRTASGGAASNQAVSSNEDVLSVAAGAGSQAGSYTITVSSLAAAAVGSFNRAFSGADEQILSDAGQSGTITFSVGQGEAAASFGVAVGPTTTAQEFVTQFNEAAAGKASARLINLGDESNPDYRIAFSTNQTGTAEGSLSIAAGNPAALDALGGSTVEQAANAVFSMSGIAGTFERGANAVNDIVPGLSLELKAEGTAFVNVAPTSRSTASQIEEFVSAYNAAVRFVNREDEIKVVQEDDGTVDSYGSLARTSIDDDAMTALREAIAGAKSGDGAVSLSGLGIATNRDGTLSFDRKQFESGFNADPARAAEAAASLADRVSGVGGVVHSFTAYGLQIDTAIASNNAQRSQLQETMARVERTASSREESILKQFTNLEGLLAKLNADSGFISSLLQF